MNQHRTVRPAVSTVWPLAFPSLCQFSLAHRLPPHRVQGTTAAIIISVLGTAIMAVGGTSAVCHLSVPEYEYMLALLPGRPRTRPPVVLLRLVRWQEYSRPCTPARNRARVGTCPWYTVPVPLPLRVSSVYYVRPSPLPALLLPHRHTLPSPVDKLWLARFQALLLKIIISRSLAGVTYLPVSPSTTLIFFFVRCLLQRLCKPSSTVLLHSVDDISLLQCHWS